MQPSQLTDRLKHELERFAELEDMLARPEVATDQLKFKEYSREHARLTNRAEKIKVYLNMLSSLEDARMILEDPSADKELRSMAKEEAAAIEETLDTQMKSIQELLIPPDPMSGRPVIMEIRAGTGGEEAALFAEDLFRMYLRFAETQGYRLELLSLMETEMGGYKEVIFSIDGDSAYDLLHQEAGAHRVQRIPVTESGGRIHTSAVTVAVLAEAEDEEVTIKESDLRVDVYRASGAGGQHVNKTESAVRLTHIPTGIVVACQDERSQIKNRAKAMRVMRTRVAEQQRSEIHARDSAIKKEQIGSGDRSERIRTYNFPQGRVTDHRINFTAYNLGAFMEGDMLELLNALHQHEKDDILAKL
jgi:peptide chain release factor 1